MCTYIMHDITLHMMLQAHTRQVSGCTVNVHPHALEYRKTLPHLVVNVQMVPLHQYAPPCRKCTNGLFAPVCSIQC